MLPYWEEQRRSHVPSIPYPHFATYFNLNILATYWMLGRCNRTSRNANRVPDTAELKNSAMLCPPGDFPCLPNSSTSSHALLSDASILPSILSEGILRLKYAAKCVTQWLLFKEYDRTWSSSPQLLSNLQAITSLEY